MSESKGLMTEDPSEHDRRAVHMRQMALELAIGTGLTGDSEIVATAAMFLAFMEGGAAPTKDTRHQDDSGHVLLQILMSDAGRPLSAHPLNKPPVHGAGYLYVVPLIP